MRFLIAVACLWSLSAEAQELPRNLLLKCEGKLVILLDGYGKKDVINEKFDTVLRLQDGVLDDTTKPHLMTRDCKLANGAIGCKFKTVIDTEHGSERRELSAYITRETGEYDHFLETWGYEGKKGTGKSRSNMKWRRTGVCTPTGGKLF